MQNYKLTLKDINPKLAKEVQQTKKETKKEIKRLKDKLNDDGFIACDLFTGEILNDDYS